MKIKKVGKVARLGRIGRREPTRVKGLELGALTGGGARQLDVMPEQLAEIARRIGEKRAKRVWKLRRQGIVGTLPELCGYDWLERRKIVFEFQSSVMGGRRMSGGAVLDFLVYGLSANGVLIWRIQGEYWHTGPEVERKDFVQKMRLRNLKIRGVPVVEVVDLWENDVYDRHPEVFELAEAGMGLRG